MVLGVGSLDKTIGINIAVASSGYPISSLKLLFGRERIAVSIVVLFEIILGMVLGVGSIYICGDNWHNGSGSLDNRSSSFNNFRGSSLDNWGSSLDNWGSICITAGIRMVSLNNWCSNCFRSLNSNRGSSSRLSIHMVNR